MTEIQIAVLIIVGAITGVGVILRQSIISKINEGFKNESYEKQKRWDLKQKIYFDLLETLYELKYLLNKMHRIHTSDHDDSEPYFKLAKHFVKEASKLKTVIATASIILSEDTSLVLSVFSDSLTKISKESEDDSVHEDAIKSATDTFIIITEIAKKDLKIESPI